jgi:hypothetical protein
VHDAIGQRHTRIVVGGVLAMFAFVCWHYIYEGGVLLPR